MKKILFLVLGGILLLSSCKEFLKEEPSSFLSTTNFYQNESDALAALNGVFTPMQAQTYYGRTVWLISELTGDNLLALGNATVDRATLNNYSFTSSNGEISNWWNQNYQLINRANDVIANVSKIQMDTVRRNDIIGNARFLRALAYFELMRTFGDLPVFLAPTGAQSTLTPTRTPVAQLYGQIIQDLKYAEANCLPENKIAQVNKGRVSSGAASSLLAKVFLTRASSSATVPTDYADGLTECNKVINSGLYKLLPVYADVFDCNKKNGAEHIFSVQFEMPPSTGNIVIRMMYPSQSGGSASFGANPVFMNSYAKEDTIRKNWNVSTKSGTATVAPYFLKYRDSQWTSQSNNSRMNWLILRYADVLLMQSEAMNQLNSSDVKKFDGINKVRARAGLTPLTATTTATKDNFIDALVNERAWELCMEGHRRWDLIRLGRLKQVVLATRNITIQDNQFLLPIPQTELDLNPSLTQNPGF